MSVVAYRINVPCEKMALVPFPHKFYSGVSILEAHVEGGGRAGRNRRRLQGGGRRRDLQVHFRLATGHATGFRFLAREQVSSTRQSQRRYLFSNKAHFLGVLLHLLLERKCILHPALLLYISAFNIWEILPHNLLLELSPQRSLTAP